MKFQNNKKLFKKKKTKRKNMKGNGIELPNIKIGKLFFIEFSGHI